MLESIALYARVSSEQQAQACTIESQIAALKERINADGYKFIIDNEFIDDGYSGSTLMRPGLEQLRDAVADRLITKLYVHSPDRLARKYAYQYLLIEEFKQYHVEIIFLNSQPGDNPESNLLLQVQGVISEYERTKIMERCRRGKLHAAKNGSVSVLSGAPYGYNYITKSKGDGIARYEINEKTAAIVRQIFNWIGKDKMSINGVANHLSDLKIETTTKKNKRWNVGSVQKILRNPAYKGTAAFGRKKSVPKKAKLKPRKGAPIVSRHYCSQEDVPENKWIYIKVPAIIDENLFEQIQVQLAENKKRKREHKQRVKFLLSGLIVCKQCEYSYVGNCVTKEGRAYYVCGGHRIYSNRREKICDNKSIRTNILDTLVWQEVQYVLNNPQRIQQEYQRRQTTNRKDSSQHQQDKLEKEKSALCKSVDRLIDAYTDGSIEKNEFTPRIKSFKERLANIEQQIMYITDSQSSDEELELLLSSINQFSEKVKTRLANLTWDEKREIVLALIKRVEIGHEEVNIIFKIGSVDSDLNHPNQTVDDYSKSRYSAISN